MPGPAGRWIAASTIGGSLWVLGGLLGWSLAGLLLAAAAWDQRGAVRLALLHVGGLLGALVAGVVATLLAVLVVGGSELGSALGVAVGTSVGGSVLAAAHALALHRRVDLQRWLVAGAVAGPAFLVPLVLSRGHSLQTMGAGALAGGIYGAATAWPLTRGDAPTHP